MTSSEPVVESANKFVIPGVVDAGLGEMTPDDGVVDPPTSDRAYSVQGPGFGTPGVDGSGPVFLAMHTSRRSAGAVGDALTTPAGPRVAVGDPVYLDGFQYRIETVELIAKPSLASSAIWSGEDDRLVIITCQQLGTGSAPSQDNLVVVASRVI